MRGIRAVCAISVATLAACSSPAEPETLPEVTEEPPAVVQPTPSLPPESPTATPVDAIEFVDQYVMLTNLALVEPRELDRWEELFATSCSVCASSFEVADEIHRQGHTISGGEWSNWKVTLADQQEDEALVVVSGSIKEATVSSTSGALVETFAAVDNVSVAYTARRQPDGTWLIVAGDVVQ